jgi:glycosyltransferase involved in cell wall biosynthesis
MREHNSARQRGKTRLFGRYSRLPPQGAPAPPPMQSAIVPCTIVMPTHNRPALLLRAVRSALQACPPTGEVLVVDDHSDVPAAQTLARIADPRLRIHRTESAGGAAAARNTGVGRAQGEIIFFLDDDDEMLADYCHRVLNQGAVASVWGFCSAFERHGDDSALHHQRQRRRLRSGLVPRRRPLRDHIAALSEGFWIRRQLFLDVGGFCAEQVVDEDTDLCCQLYRLGHCAWYESEPGVIVYKGYRVADRNAAQLTRATPHDVLLGAYRRTFERNQAGLPPHSEARWYLCARYLRRAAHAGLVADGSNFLKRLGPSSLRGLATLYWWTKRCRLRGRKG